MSAAPRFSEVVAALERMSEAELAAVSPAPPTSTELVARFPELAAVEERDVEIEGPHGAVPARLYRTPGPEAAAGLMWVHGGGFIAGDLAMPEAHWVGMMLAARGFPVLSVDYRKCLRGVRYPVPSDDVLAAWSWAVGRAEELGVALGALAMGGASAGANLTAGVTKRLRDGAGPVPASLVLAYPLVHAALPPASAELTEAMARLEPELTFPPDVVRDINLHFVGDEAGLADPYAFAANGDVSGQPPVFVLTSEADTLRSSGEAYAEQLHLAGVPVRVEVEPDTVHGHLNEPFTDGAQRSIDRIAHWLLPF